MQIPRYVTLQLEILLEELANTTSSVYYIYIVRLPIVVAYVMLTVTARSVRLPTLPLARQFQRLPSYAATPGSVSALQQPSSTFLRIVV